MPKVPGLRVVRSSIHGYGVVAVKAFAEDEQISEIEGVAWREGDGVDDRYSLWIEDGLYFDMVDQTRFINHSCDPNAWVDAGVTDDGQVWATIIALRPIAIGEEISYDYAFPPDLAEPCRCGSSACRGLIIEEDAVPLRGSAAR
jgi:SET domain-containing protein